MPDQRPIARYGPTTAASHPDGRLCSPVFARNAEPIRAALAPRIGSTGTVLEIGSGTGQHAAFFARAFPDHRWVPSDPEPGHRHSIRAWAAAEAPMLAPPLALDATTVWADDPAVRALGVTVVFAANVIHIAPWAVAQGLVAGAGRLLEPGGRLILYGPFRQGGRHIGEGNRRFDAALRAENPAWGVRDIDDVAALAAAAGFTPPEIVEMPSNNRLVAWRRA